MSLSLAFSLDLSELLNTMSPSAKVGADSSGFLCVAARLLFCLSIISFWENCKGLPVSMSLPVQSSMADMPVHRGFAFNAEMAAASWTSEIWPPDGATPSMASCTSLLDFSATGLPFLFSGLLLSMATPMSWSGFLLSRLMKLFALSALHTRSQVD